MSTVYSNSPNGRVSFSWIGEAFNIYTRNAGTWILAVLISSILGVIISLIFQGNTFFVIIPDLLQHITPPPQPQQNTFESLTLSLVRFLISSFFYTGLFKMANKAVNNEPITLSDLFSGVNNLGSFLLFGFLFGIAMLMGVVLCCVGAFFVWYFFWPVYSLLADGESMGSAFSRVTSALQADAINGAFFVFVLLLLYVATVVPTCGLASFVTVPMSYIISALMVRDMLGPKFTEAIPTAGSWPPAPSAPGSQFFTPAPPPPTYEPWRQFFDPAPQPPAESDTNNQMPRDDSEHEGR